MMEQRVRLKTKLRSRAPVFGAWISFYHPAIAEIFCEIGVDFVGIDIEHSTIDLSEARNIIAACQAQGVPCLPRVASHNAEAIRRLLDAGADGIILPQAGSLADVERLVEWTKYPPAGRRGFGVARAQGYGFTFDDYTRRWNDSSCLIVQVESIAGVDAADAMLAHEHVDAAMVGPYDLSGSLGVPGQLHHPAVRDAADRVVRACVARAKACATQDIDPTPESLRRALAAGYNLIVLASDLFVLWKWADRMRATLAAVARPAETA